MALQPPTRGGYRRWRTRRVPRAATTERETRTRAAPAMTAVGTPSLAGAEGAVAATSATGSALETGPAATAIGSAAEGLGVGGWMTAWLGAVVAVGLGGVRGVGRGVGFAVGLAVGLGAAGAARGAFPTGWIETH